jgi:hypothetical protein
MSASLPERATLSEMKKTLSDQIANNPTQFNIEAIAKLEHEAFVWPDIDRARQRRNCKIHWQHDFPPAARSPGCCLDYH